MDDVLSRNDLRDDKNYVVQYYSKHFEHIVDFLTTFFTSGTFNCKTDALLSKKVKLRNTAGRKNQR